MKPLIRITRKEHFNAAHKMFRPDWTEQQNEAVFGKCAFHNWHGHNYELFVTIEGSIHPVTGYVADLKALSEMLKRKIVDVLDHKNLNLDVPFMHGILASTEHLALKIWEEIEPEIPKLGNCTLYKIQLFETERNFVELVRP